MLHREHNSRRAVSTVTGSTTGPCPGQDSTGGCALQGASRACRHLWAEPWDQWSALRCLIADEAGTGRSGASRLILG